MQKPEMTRQCCLFKLIDGKAYWTLSRLAKALNGKHQNQGVLLSSCRTRNIFVVQLLAILPGPYIVIVFPRDHLRLDYDYTNHLFTTMVAIRTFIQDTGTHQIPCVACQPGLKRFNKPPSPPLLNSPGLWIFPRTTRP